MKEYLLLFRNISGANDYITTAQDMAEDMPAWQGWIGSIAQQGILILTQPITYQGTVISNSGVTNGPSKDSNQHVIAGYLLCKADSDEEVQGWSKTCPILKYANGSVEIRTIISFPNP